MCYSVDRSREQGALFDEAQVWEFFVQIVMALKYVHSCNVLHRDLKSQNIMLSGPQQRTIKLGDFGIAKVHRVCRLTSQLWWCCLLAHT